MGTLTDEGPFILTSESRIGASAAARAGTGEPSFAGGMVKGVVSAEIRNHPLNLSTPVMAYHVYQFWKGVAEAFGQGGGSGVGRFLYDTAAHTVPGWNAVTSFDEAGNAYYVEDNPQTAGEKFVEGVNNTGQTIAIGIVGYRGFKSPATADPAPRTSELLRLQKEISLKTLQQGTVVDRWLRTSSNRWAQLYRSNAQSDPNFAAGIRGRFIDVRMRAWFRTRFGTVPGVRIDQTIPGSGNKLRPDLYLPNVEGRSVIFDVGGKSKIKGIGQYSGMADDIIPITH